MTATFLGDDNEPFGFGKKEGCNCMFKFTIRDWLWLTVVVALMVAWWIERRNCAAKVSELEAWSGELVRLLVSDGWDIQSGHGRTFAEKGQRSVQMHHLPTP